MANLFEASYFQKLLHYTFNNTHNYNHNYQVAVFLTKSFDNVNMAYVTWVIFTNLLTLHS